MSTAPPPKALGPSSAREVARYASYTRWSVALAAPTLWIIFAFPLFTNFHRYGEHALPLVGFSLGSAALAAFVTVPLMREGALYLKPTTMARPRGTRVSLIAIAASWAVCLLLTWITNEVLAVWAGIYAMFCNALFALAHAPWMKRKWLVTTVAIALTCVLSHGFASGTIFAMILVPYAFLFATVSALWGIKVLRNMDYARELDAELKVSEERLRFAQELHDTMGQRLAAISLKSQVALALAEKNKDVTHELRELQELVKVSTNDMRDVAHGYRRPNLATEIAEARSLLAAASITCDVQGDSLDVPEEHREAAAWFVREATTNILRHSHASHVRLILTRSAVTLINDGAPSPPGPLSGLAALRQRVRESEASIEIEHDSPQFTVRLCFNEGAAAVGPDPTHAPEERA